MKLYIKSILLSFSVFFISSCDEFDPAVGIENPNLLLENVIGSPGSTGSWLVGQERQMAIVYNRLLELTELGSDNYENVQTFFNQQFDALNILFQDGNVNNLASRIADLRTSANVGLQFVQPADPDGTDAQRAELLFFAGWAKMLAGELFVALPDTELPDSDPASPKTPTENLQAAVADFLAAEALDAANAGYKLALARAYHNLGDQANAVIKANEAITADPTYTRTVEFDGPNALGNVFADALFQRGNFDDLQPLPRLDFLDPKYFVDGEDESPVYIQKSEEAYLILAEAELANNDIPAARGHLTSLLTLVNSRAMNTFDDSVEGRDGTRPATAAVTVAASDGEALKAGLVIDRQLGDVTVARISGTSIVQADIDALADQLVSLEMLYLMRQEIFIAEGRRFVDLGIKIPISENEQLLNPAVTSTHILAVIPSYVPTDMDAFTFDDVLGQVTITHNMNAVLVANRADGAVIPFF
ncbi:MAG: hypothetical protein ABJP45_16930 [Cyclobacteriaceae bacterium]